MRLPFQLNTQWLQRLFPFLSWLPGLTRLQLRPDLEAGFIGAVLILPQSIALATLAGMPPEYGIYTSIFPVVIAAFWGSSWHALSGPNTAVCVMIGASVAPFANIGNEYYVGYVLCVTLMVGLIQMALGLFKLGTILDFISNTVVNSIILAVALIMIVSALSALVGVMSALDEPFFARIYLFLSKFTHLNPYTFGVGLVTIASGIVARKYLRRYALVVAVVVGSVLANLINLLVGSATTGIAMVGYLSLSMFPFSAPTLDLESLYVIKELIGSAFAIAFLGLMQTVLIARSLAEKSGQQIDTNQEMVGQGLSNLVAPFISSFASSASFNRSAAHYDVGAKTPMAALFASAFLVLLVLIAAGLIAYIPLSVVAAVLMLVGYWLIEPSTIKKVLCTRQESIIFFVTLFTALAFGLNAGVFTGLLLSLVVYLWYASTPNVVVRLQTGPDELPVHVVTIDGNLFFGSVRHVERVLRGVGKPNEKTRILLRTDHITYIDAPGAALIANELKGRRDKGDEMYIYIARSNVVGVLRATGCLQQFGENYVMVRGLDHPMKQMLYPTDNGKYAPVMD